ncbi:MaoC/PaaZ C-terminal domain-containing protein [Saccharophagus degradans]|uniref:MaoC-like dehydratase n=2 Tax=Saccharophagus degradans TaxID=86304 RepID=Q21HX4_SACD2|nr:MaoC/PaaZ C-terminal domain-containing protein [Saccharophagus degradans]ABD81705.1 MaoC-like dehydratase [Saccharophagus degradans 2-40]MBU2986419.1 MaoC family dehydratase [Saccharophagus degradans]MDO6424492.1 MaoC/PaaZ C-terminal domain-containing protein [Saccharophagus degradans]MDO6608885.1 MaoC/PaaZ C-terminal domain-containing protein [Saccharophagus degradans]WGP00084.1 MaoC/PaaZ C-terminal domain-containing protein [Saccharophagus degradans]
MNVLEIIKEKKEKIVERKVELNDLVFPQLRDYWNEFWLNAKNNHWLKWGMESVVNQPANDTELDPEDVIANVCDNPSAEALRQSLVAKIGEVSYVGEWLVVDQSKIDGFAAVTEDNQWIHTDVERAQAESTFKSTIAHGLLTLSLLPKLTGVVDSDASPYPDCRMVINLGLNKVRFPAPLKSGNRVRAIKKVVSVDVVKRGLMVEEEVIVEVEHSARPACVANPIYRFVF